MRSTAHRGRIYRRCGCRDQQGRQLGASCPQLTTEPDHGTWTFAVDLPSPTHRRGTIRRGGFPTEERATTALHRLLEGEHGGFDADPNQTLADYLTTWLKDKQLTLKPTTYAHLSRLHPPRPHPRPRRRPPRRPRPPAHRRLRPHPTRPAPRQSHRPPMPRNTLQRPRRRRPPPKAHPQPRPADPHPPPCGCRTRHLDRPEAIRFLRYCHAVDPSMDDLVEVLIGTGIRKGEALGLHWNDVHIDQQVLYVRYTLSAVDNNHLVLTTQDPQQQELGRHLPTRRHRPPTPRHRQDPRAMSGHPRRPCLPPADGQPLHPEYVLNHFHYRSRQAGVPRTTVHDLRHHLHHRRRPPHRGLQDPAPLHALHHGEHL
jgi:integrase